MSNMFTLPGIKASRISAPVGTNNAGETADWSGLGRGIAEAGANIASGIQASKTNLQIAEGQLEKGKQPVDKTQGRINQAKAEGKDAKAARLEGRKERRDIRDTNKALRITAKNIDKKNELIKKELFKGQKFNEKQKEKGGATSNSHLIKPLEIKTAGLGSPFNMKMSAKQYADQQKFSKIAKNI